MIEEVLESALEAAPECACAFAQQTKRLDHIKFLDRSNLATNCIMTSESPFATLQ